MDQQTQKSRGRHVRENVPASFGMCKGWITFPYLLAMTAYAPWPPGAMNVML